MRDRSFCSLRRWRGIVPSLDARWKGYLETVGQVQDVRYDYMGEGRRRPDPLPRLIAAHRYALTEAGKQTNEPVILMQSMGGRVACMVSLENGWNGCLSRLSSLRWRRSGKVARQSC